MVGTELFQCEFERSDDELVILRANLESDGDAYEWLASYREATKTSWIFDWRVQNPQRIVFHERWRCQNSSLNKTAGRYSTSCPAFVDIKIKKVTRGTKKNDAFLKRPVPLAAVVRLREDHNHNLGCADGLRLLKCSPDTRARFHGYFQDGLNPAESMSLHQEKMAAAHEAQDQQEHLASGHENPTARTVYHWYEVWRRQHHGELVDPIIKLGEKAPMYLQNGADVRTARSQDGCCWAVLVVTEIMRRTQQLAAASEVVFVDSTSSTDGTQSTTTVLLAATKAGAIPLAVLLHNCQSIDSYVHAFHLLKSNYPACFGGAHVPQAFLTDDSPAEKAALRTTWPESTQLLCHFHVGRAEWRWLCAAANQLGRDERRDLMSAFQKIMYAETPEKLEAAVGEMRAKSHQGYVQRVMSFLERQTEWVLLFRSDLTARGHDTNNFAEASIRVLKDIMLQRRKAYGVVALVDFVASVWEDSFRRRLLAHAHNREPMHQLLYDRLLRRTPCPAAQAVSALDAHTYQVPSGAADGKVYEVHSDVGMCTCAAGRQGAFCKHQALVHHQYGGAFPDAPLLSAHDCHQMGLLALGDKYQPATLFQGFQEPPEQPSTGTAVEETPASVEPSSASTMEHQELASLDDSPSLDPQENGQGDDPVSTDEEPMESAPLRECVCCIAWKAGVDSTYRCVQERPATHDVALRVDMQGKAAVKDASVQTSAEDQQAATHIQGSLLGRTAIGTQVNFQQAYATMTSAVQMESWAPSFPVLLTPSLLSPASAVPPPIASLPEQDLDLGQEMDEDWSTLSELSGDEMCSRNETIESGLHLQDEKAYVVSESCLLELFTVCRTCLMKCKPSLTVKGTLVKVETICKDAHYHTWSNQPILKGMAAGSLAGLSTVTSTSS